MLVKERVVNALRYHDWARLVISFFETRHAGVLQDALIIIFLQVDYQKKYQRFVIYEVLKPFKWEFVQVVVDGYYLNLLGLLVAV